MNNNSEPKETSVMVDVASVRSRIAELSVFDFGPGAVLFDRQTMSIRPLNKATAQTLNDLLHGSRVLPDTSTAWQDLICIVQAFTEMSTSNLLAGVTPPPPACAGDRIRNQIDPNRYLHKLALNIANDCNLACTYCYANQGLYGTPQRLLVHVDDIENTVRRFASRFDYIESVQFMGGEPSLNSAAVDRVGRVVEQLVHEGRLAGIPEYKMVTNGVRFSPKFLDVAAHHRVELTISLDGPEEVHDFIRTRVGGGGSYRAIRKNIEVSRARGIVVDFEATFSKRHVDCGIHLIDLCSWFAKEFGVRSLHAPPMSENRYGTEPLALSESEKALEYSAVTEWGVDNLLERGQYLMHSFTARLLESLEKRIPNRVTCPAGNSMVSVSAKGEVSPCWMYTDEAPFRLGHVNDPVLLGEEAQAVLREMSRYELHSHPLCQSCFIQPLCFGCKGGDYHSTRSFDGKTGCDYMRAMVASLVVRLLHRPTVPTTTQEYLSQPPYGASRYEALRPDILHESTATAPEPAPRFDPGSIARGDTMPAPK